MIMSKDDLAGGWWLQSHIKSCSCSQFAECPAFQTQAGAVPLTSFPALLLFADVSYEYLGQDAFCRVNETSAERIQFEVGGPGLLVLCVPQSTGMPLLHTSLSAVVSAGQGRAALTAIGMQSAH